MNIGIRLAKFLNSIGLEVIIFPVRDRNKVIALCFELALEVAAMVDAGTKDYSLLRSAKDIIGLLNPLGDDIPCDLHTALGYFFFFPFAECVLAGARHVNLFSNKDFERG